jgi:hypothetical protein
VHGIFSKVFLKNGFTFCYPFEHWARALSRCLAEGVAALRQSDYLLIGHAFRLWARARSLDALLTGHAKLLATTELGEGGARSLD